MMKLSRRSLMAGAAGLPLIPATAATAPAAETVTPPTEVTRTLARFIVGSHADDLPAAVRKEGIRTLLNYVGVAIGGSHHATVAIAVDALAPFAGPPQAGLFGRRERFDILNAAFVNGVASHVFDYDDTHLKTIIHPGGPVISALLALAELRPVSGRDFLTALILGVETECRLGNAVWPDHYDAGWHITGTTGVFGAAAAAGRLLGLDEQRMIWALGLAASQPVGLRESFGSMNKSFNPGRAASNGLFAAILAAKGFTSSDAMIEARRGWAHTVSTRQSWSEITDGLGQRYESALNSYKPFACGIVLHPAIDAAIRLRQAFGLVADQVAAVRLQVNPLVLELTGKKTPREGLEGKFSVYHAVAIALIAGAAGEKQFSDGAVRDPAVVALRGRVIPQVDAAMRPEQVDMTIELTDGRRLHQRIEHAIGSTESPMSDQALAAKFADLAEGILPARQTEEVMRLCRTVEQLTDAGDIVKAGVALA